MTLTTAQVMLTLTGLAYRGFHDLLPGDPHEVIVRRAVQEGLDTLEPVRGDWTLVWGPVTSRGPLGVFDSSAMYVVRHRRDHHRYVVALRGTNPISSSDWLFGDFLVGTTVGWPYASDGSAISTSTALGLTILQGVRSRPLSPVARFAEASLETIGGVFDRVVRAGRAAVTGINDAHVASQSALEVQVERILEHWSLGQANRDQLRDQFQHASDEAHLRPATLRKTLLPIASRGEGLDLLTFLRTQADETRDALDVTLTGHSKGGALAATLALWLQAALESSDAEDCWDPTRRARVSCYTFAAPTPGNAAFARQLERRLGDRQHHYRNAHDVGPQVWQVETLQQIPGIYGPRGGLFGPLVSGIAESVRSLSYRHSQVGVVLFVGKLGTRSLAGEVIHQHLDAYLAELGLLDRGISAVDFFI